MESLMSLDRVGKYWPETLSILRIVIGLMFLEHGSAKLLGFPHPATAMPAMGSLLWVQGVIELVGGALIALGLFTRPVAFILAGDMAVAYFMAHAPKDFFPLLNGGDAAILYCCSSWPVPAGGRSIRAQVNKTTSYQAQNRFAVRVVSYKSVGNPLT
jgi:putative oxidoreductase